MIKIEIFKTIERKVDTPKVDKPPISSGVPIEIDNHIKQENNKCC